MDPQREMLADLLAKALARKWVLEQHAKALPRQGLPPATLDTPPPTAGGGSDADGE